MNGRVSNMYDTVHIDEKWFYMTREKRNYYVLRDEPVPYRAVQSKKFITKVMFMAAVARPRHDHHRNRNFDGLIGIWPYTIKEPAKKKSKNRPAGAIVTNVIKVTRVETRKMIIEKDLSCHPGQVPMCLQEQADLRATGQRTAALPSG